MNKRDAKRQACFMAALVIRNALAAGWELDGYVSTPADEARVESALQEVVDELARRGWKRRAGKGSE